MVRFTVLGSGSKGNATVVTGGSTRILVDAGMSCREIFKRMNAAGEDPAALDAIVITHEHDDHIRGVAVTARKLGIPVYFTEATHRAWVRELMPTRKMTYAEWAAQRQVTGDRLQVTVGGQGIRDKGQGDDEVAAPKKDPAWLPAVEFFQAGQAFQIGDIAVSPFTIPHDAADPCGFVFQAEGVRMAVATDLGYVPPNVKACLKNLDLLMIESNHDLEMLRDGPYPWQVKQRVLSRVGHLSNDAASEFLEREYDGGARYVILGHLSESNNLPELARVSAERALSGRGTLLGNGLMLAEQELGLESISF